MNPLDFINRYIVVLNSLIIFILVLKYLQGLRRYHLDYKKLKIEHEKLKIELESLRSEAQKSRREIIEAFPVQIHKYVIEPLSEEIRRGLKDIGGMLNSHHDSLFKSGQQLSQELRQFSADTRAELNESASHLRQIAAATEEIRLDLSKLQGMRLHSEANE